MLFRLSGLVQASEVEVNLLGCKIVVWSSLTMFDCTAEMVALALVVVEVAFGACTAAGCS